MVSLSASVQSPSDHHHHSRRRRRSSSRQQNQDDAADDDELIVGKSSSSLFSQVLSKSSVSSIGSPLSVLEQWQRDAKGAVEDAYANYVLGDDTGEASRLVLVSNPYEDFQLIGKGDNTIQNGTSNNTAQHQQQHPPHILLNEHTTQGRGSNGRLQAQQPQKSRRRGVPQRKHLLVSHQEYYTDANYKSLSASIMNAHPVLQRNFNKKNPHVTQFASGGVTYVEINQRAYVQAIDEGSAAYLQAGIRVKDCVQYAAVLAQEWEDPCGPDDFPLIRAQAFEREETGQRITYDELKRVFLQGSGLINETQSDYQYDPQSPGGILLGPSGDASSSQYQHVPQVPSTIRIGVKNSYCGGGGSFVCTDDDDDDTTVIYTDEQHPTPVRTKKKKPTNKKQQNAPRPVVLVFRRTKQRPQKAWNVWPNYRLDDECDVACQLLQSLTTPTPAILETKTINSSSSSSRRQQQYQQQQQQQQHRNDGLNTPFDDDDDDGTAFFSVNNSEAGCSKTLFPSMSPSEKNRHKQNIKNRNPTNPTHANEEYTSDADTKNTTKDSVEDTSMNEVEASTIRGMIQKAVGLAFVRSNKVVFGVSVSGGSGIVVSRLSDGTWSAPSFIGMAGMGFGIQIGVEVAHYIFILQSQEALEHFQRGGSFTVGGNVGLAVAGMFGREAIGAASVSSALCGITTPPPPIKEDEYNYEDDEEDLYFASLQTTIDDDYDVNTKTGEQVLNSDRRRRRLRRQAKQFARGSTSCGGGMPTCGGSGINRRRRRSTSCTNANTATTASNNSLASNSKESNSSSSLSNFGCHGNLNVASLLLESGTTGVAPIVAYAKSEGLYVGVSLEGSRIFTRNEMNARAYKYSSYKHQNVTARDILTGKIVSRPYEAECLYSLLHQIEFTHELSCLPPLPRSIGSSSKYSNTGRMDSGRPDWTRSWEANSPPYPIKDEIDDYYTKFQNFLFGGFVVLRISPTNPNKREQRTLWLQSTGSLVDSTNNNTNTSFNSSSSSSVQIGFVSKLYSATAQRKHLSASIIQDVSRGSGSNGNHFGMSGYSQCGASVVSETDGDELTLDSALMDNQSLLTTTGTLQERVELSKKLSMDLVDVVSLTTQKVPPEIRLLDREEGERAICIESLDTQLVFVGRTLEETQFLFCGLKILLEKETARIGIRGGQGTGKSGSRKRSSMKTKNGNILFNLNRKNVGSGYGSSDIDETDHDQSYDPSEYYHNYNSPSSSTGLPHPRCLPEGWRSWGRVPGRPYMRAQSASTVDGYPTYAHGQLLIRDVCNSVLLPLPLPLCRVLLLDSSSPVISKWESDRGDADFERTSWTFPPATPREREQFQSEHQLIASGSMCGAHRTISYERYRNGQPVRLSETHIVDSDDSEKLAFQVTERLPRRGFSIKVKIILCGVDNGSSCEATVLGEIRPVGKNMSDPAAVHKALLKVMEELRNRYGTDCVGLLAGFMSVIENMPKDETRPSNMGASPTSSSHWRSDWEEKKESDYRSSKNQSPRNKKPLDKTSVVKFQDVMSADLGGADNFSTKFAQEVAQERRPSNAITAKDYKSRGKSRLGPIDDDTFASISDPVTIEVKPLPKIRLSLMPSPREEDENNLDEDGDPVLESSKKKEKKKPSKSKSKSRSKRSSWGKKKKSSSSSNSN